MQELPIIQRTYDLIRWYVPILTRLPRNHKFMLGDRITGGLYDLLEALIRAKYESQKLKRLEPLNSDLDILRHLRQQVFASLGFSRANGNAEKTRG
ncbi:MAG: diversity-generating retroelement protein Avd [Synechococcales cyanobacterium]